MEKQTAGFCRKRCFGLLIFLLLAAVNATELYCQAAKPSWQYVQSLRFKKTKDIYFTDEDSYFTVDIEGVEPENVVVFVNDVPRNVSFVSSRKEAFLIPGENPLDEGSKGCRLVIAFRFSQPGYFHIMPIDVRVNDMYNRIAVDNVRVYENPNTVQPELFLQFEDPRFNAAGKNLNVKSGDHITFTLFIRYAVQLINFNWKIPEDSIFTELERFEITEGNPRGNDFSPDAVPVAKFDWQPFALGAFRLPEIKITATTYSGKKVDVDFPKYTVNVAKASAPLDFSVEGENVFAYAFTVPSEAVLSKPAKADVTLEELKQLLELHKKERYSLPLISSACYNRKEAEEKAGVFSGSMAPSVPAFAILLFLSILFFAVGAFLFFTKRISGHLALFSILLLFDLTFVTGAVYTGRLLSRDYALFIGGQINPIPETGVKSDAVIKAGSLVQIDKRAGGWVYIKYNDTRGWVRQNKVLLVD